jgi:DNA gyrase/topoisomerase IV subunit B
MGREITFHLVSAYCLGEQDKLKNIRTSMLLFEYRNIKLHKFKGIGKHLASDTLLTTLHPLVRIVEQAVLSPRTFRTALVVAPS